VESENGGFGEKKRWSYLGSLLEHVFLGLFSKFYDKELYRESSGDACSQDTKKNTSWLFSNYTQKNHALII
jgi:hypothetical protein